MAKRRREQREPDQSTPKDWLNLVTQGCDLERAFHALEGWEHFHTDTIRGRIRSLQLRPQEAWDFFERAEGRAGDYGQTLRNLLRRFFLKLYRFENALVEESAAPGSQPGRTERCLQALLADDVPDTDITGQLRLYQRALYLLHQQDYRCAIKLFRQLLRASRGRFGDEQTGFYLGAAAAYRGLGKKKDAERQLENASLAIPALDNAFNMGHFSGIASAVLTVWGRGAEAGEWDQFIDRLQIPDETARLFRERARRIVERSRSLGYLFLF